MSELRHVVEISPSGCLMWRPSARQLPFHLVPRHDVALLQGFDGVQAARPLVLRQQHLQGEETCKSAF